jgi:hypothetical protein
MYNQAQAIPPSLGCKSKENHSGFSPAFNPFCNVELLEPFSLECPIKPMTPMKFPQPQKFRFSDEHFEAHALGVLNEFQKFEAICSEYSGENISVKKSIVIQFSNNPLMRWNTLLRINGFIKLLDEFSPVDL